MCLQAAGAADQLSNPGLVATVLAPTNAAFQASWMAAHVWLRRDACLYCPQ